MDIKSISASRIKTYQHCQFKYILNYMLKECKDCGETFYTPEMHDDNCPHCGSENFGRVSMRSNWGAVHGTALHQVMENYALAIRGTREDGTPVTEEEKEQWLNWEEEVRKIYFRGTDNGQTDPDFAIYDLAKPKDVNNEDKWCENCKTRKENALCYVTGETLREMQARGCQGCPEGLYEESMELMAKYVARYKPVLHNRKILGVEAFFDLDFGVIDIHGNPVRSIGYIDLVTELDEDTIEVVDHKFGAWVPSFEEFHEDVQVKLYSLAARQLFPGYKEYIITFDYARKNPLSMAYTPEEDAETKKYVINQWEKIAGPQRVKRTMVQGNGRDPESSWKCKVMCCTETCKKQWPIFKEKFGGS